jgi:hypothetical protein
LRPINIVDYLARRWGADSFVCFPSGAEKLARFARLDPQILRPISHRTVEQQEALTLIRARAVTVRLRTAAVNAVRGLTKACGHRVPASSTRCFAERSLATMPPGLARALAPVLEQIAQMTLKIKQYDRLIIELTQTEYPETQALLEVQGVGHITALTFVLTLGNKQRFRRSRDVGCYLGLRPRRSQSGDRDPQLGITKAGGGIYNGWKGLGGSLAPLPHTAWGRMLIVKVCIVLLTFFHAGRVRLLLRKKRNYCRVARLLFDVGFAPKRS